jgi:hypothetical protein
MSADTSLSVEQWATGIVFVLWLTVPVVVVSAWCLKRRYAVAIVRLQEAIALSRTVPSQSASSLEAAPSTSHDILPALKVNFLPAHEAPIASDGVDVTAAFRRLRRRVLSVQFGVGLLYWWCYLSV